MTVPITVALCIYAAYIGWVLFWKAYNWRYRWRVHTRPGSREQIEVYAARGFGGFSSDRTLVAAITITDDNFYEKLHEAKALTEERCREINELDKEFKAK